MALIIAEECISCGACVSECPNHAILEGDLYYVINPDRCTKCVGFFAGVPNTTYSVVIGAITLTKITPLLFCKLLPFQPC